MQGRLPRLSFDAYCTVLHRHNSSLGSTTEIAKRMRVLHLIMTMMMESEGQQRDDDGDDDDNDDDDNATTK